MIKDIDKVNKTIHFIEKWFIIGLVLFFIIQVGGYIVIEKVLYGDVQEFSEDFQEDYIGHWYDGTYFINMTISENFESKEKFEEMSNNYNNNIYRDICECIGMPCMLIGLGFILIAAYKERKNKLLEGRTPIYIILGGAFFLFYKIFEEADMFIDAWYYGRYSKGFLSTCTYYPQIYNILTIPGLLIALGLILRQKQKKDLCLSTKNNERLIKILIGCIIVIGCSFIGYRFGVRTYELVSNLVGKNMNIRVPYYYFMLDIPVNFAKSGSIYTKLVILRYFKDLPVFISSTISILLFSKILGTSLNGKLVSKENDKRYKIIFISLFISSIILNLVGLLEVNYFQNNFLYQYSEATYTIAIRSLSEPLLYAGFIFIFYYYIELTHRKVKKKK